MIGSLKMKTYRTHSEACTQASCVPQSAALIRVGMAVLCLTGMVAACQAQPVRVIRFAEGKPFQMGKVTSRRIVHPDLGAKRTTLNYSVSTDGSEFSQHVHDISDDTILVPQGQMDLRQGDSRVPYKAGQCAFVPAGQIH